MCMDITGVQIVHYGFIVLLKHINTLVVSSVNNFSGITCCINN